MPVPLRTLGLQLRSTLWDMTPRDHRQSDREFRRRQIVAAVVVVIGALVLAFSLSLDSGSNWFYVATLVLAAVWAVGAFASGPAAPRSRRHRRDGGRPTDRPADPRRPRPLGRVRRGRLRREADPASGRPGGQRARLRQRRERDPGAARDRDQRDRGGDVLPRGALRRDQEEPGADHGRRLRDRDRRHGQRHAVLRGARCSASWWVSSDAPVAASWRRSSRTSPGR